MKLEEACSRQFTEELADKFKWNAVKMAKENIRDDQHLAQLWNKLISKGECNSLCTKSDVILRKYNHANT